MKKVAVFAVFCSDNFVYFTIFSIFTLCKLLVFIVLYESCSFCSKMGVFCFSKNSF